MLDRLGDELFGGRRAPGGGAAHRARPGDQSENGTATLRIAVPFARARRGRAEEGRRRADRLGRATEADYHPPGRARPPHARRRRSSSDGALEVSFGRGRWPPLNSPHQCVELCPICRGAEVLRATSSPELRGQWQSVQREALVTMRALIDHYLERLDETRPRRRPQRPASRRSRIDSETLSELRHGEPRRARKFCMSCGAPLPTGLVCRCGTENPPGRSSASSAARRSPAPPGGAPGRPTTAEPPRRSGARRRSCSPTSPATPPSPSGSTRSG